MLRQYLLLALLALLTTCCAAHVSLQPPAPYPHPTQVMYFLGDVDFTPQERHWIEDALTLLAAQTHGYVAITVDWSLNFEDIDSLNQAIGRDKLIRVDKSAPPVVEFNAEHCCLLGLTRWPVETDDLSTDVFLVFDQIESDDDPRALFVHVTMHELLHALGLGHVNDPSALMYRSTTFGTPSAFTCADYREASRAWGASVRRLSGGRCAD